MIDKETLRKLTLAPLRVSKINDENRVNISSSGNLSLGASGGISLSGGRVSISGSNKVLVQKNKSSYISLEGECYNQSNAVYENGSCREPFEKFTDDEPTAGVQEALAELEYKNELLSLSILGSNVMLNVVMQNDKINDINKSENNNSTIDKSGNSGSDGKSTLTSTFYALGGGISKFSTFTRDASLEFGEKVLGLNYDQCAVDSKSNKKLREMYAEDDKRDAEDYDKLREKASNKDVFDNVSKVTSGGLILTDIVLAGHGLINIAKSRISLAKLSGKAQNILKFGDKIANKSKNTVNKIGELNRLKNTKGVSKASKGGNSSVLYGTGDIAKYEFNMIENPGPLADMQGNPASNFYGGRYNAEVLAEDRIYYRGGNSDNALGQWFATEPPESVAKVRIDTAVKPQWIDPITGELTGESVVDTVYAIKIPKGTKVYTGPVGPQGGTYCGGYDVMQSFINEPWKLDYKVISSSPLN
ncbi:hypothetical protein FDB44_16040 [Clostridium botulinum]|uniref:hypothetical protein n=2 Tax=Clostridium botulinum TaxID=1491 RepID=UPI0013F04DD1|nr:hypothetical protein [Clostridium botulinum]MBY6935706.1 hypothetical protein [Clostridium botulinum]NFL83402.1 hypothetical protein [Clostridium botulinum]NFN13243.1 hypothetical protein [Clostridium botulinum]NFO38312.1 hypothetical protein [Clostridium botulinum]NFO45083.1 hypothetical protein [Clostridium botulinum]